MSLRSLTPFIAVFQGIKLIKCLLLHSGAASDTTSERRALHSMELLGAKNPLKRPPPSVVQLHQTKDPVKLKASNHQMVPLRIILVLVVGEPVEEFL
jgi:hypothetical protein